MPLIASKLQTLYPAFASMPDEALERTLAGAVVRTVPAGTVLFDENSACQAFPMILEGSVRVVKSAPSGRELQLYRVLPGESCILSTGCMMGNAPYSASGIAESELTLVALPPAPLPQAAERACAVSQLRVRPVHRAHHRADAAGGSGRVPQARPTAGRAAPRAKGRVVHTTHQQLADELGSVREIVSRLLKTFAERGLVSLGREEIELVNPPALRRIAEGA